MTPRALADMAEGLRRLAEVETDVPRDLELRHQLRAWCALHGGSVDRVTDWGAALQITDPEKMARLLLEGDACAREQIMMPW